MHNNLTRLPARFFYRETHTADEYEDDCKD